MSEPAKEELLARIAELEKEAPKTKKTGTLRKVVTASAMFAS